MVGILGGARATSGAGALETKVTDANAIKIVDFMVMSGGCSGPAGRMYTAKGKLSLKQVEIVATYHQAEVEGGSRDVSVLLKLIDDTRSSYMLMDL